ncbi:MAG: succinate dehydrogenase cytochrome b subunit [bacterium]|nr:succinate dehydrogenase cytochrome b subunit [bacterium]
MSLLIEIFKTSVGKKFYMAISGLLLLGFLVFHLSGNSTLIFGHETFAAFVDFLAGTGPLIYFAELILALIFLSHIFLGIILTLSNWKARNVKYSVSNSRGGQTFASKTMPYTGFILLLFLIIHLLDYTITKYMSGWDGWQLAMHVSDSFKNFARLSFYIFAVIVLGVHISHGFWSLFQSIGVTHTQYTKMLQKLAKVLGVLFAIGFATIPFIAVTLAK